MPSFALQMNLVTYLQQMENDPDPHVQAYRMLLHKVLAQPLRAYDALFTEEGALKVAAGVFFFGRKFVDGPSEVIPPLFRALWEQDPQVKKQTVDLYNLGTHYNIMTWAKGVGRRDYSAVANYFEQLVPFRKNDTVGEEGWQQLEAVPAFEPLFHTLGGSWENNALEETNDTEHLMVENAKLTEIISEKNRHIEYLESLINRLESGRIMRALKIFGRK